MAPTPSILIKKTFTYRGGAKTFTNRYHFSGGTPADAAHWTTLADAVVADEKAIYSNVVQIVQAVGYAAGSDVPIFTKTYATAGTASFTASRTNPGDVAIMVRFSTDAFSSRNHPIYLWSWYHNAFGDSGGTIDAVNPGQKTAINAYASAWIAGYSDGTNTYHRAGPRGAVALTRTVDPFLRHRDFRH